MGTLLIVFLLIQDLFRSITVNNVLEVGGLASCTVHTCILVYSCADNIKRGYYGTPVTRYDDTNTDTNNNIMILTLSNVTNTNHDTDTKQ